MEKRAVVFTFAEWPLSRALVEAYALPEPWMKIPHYFANVILDIDDLPEKEPTKDDKERIDALVFQLAQSFLRDPLVRKDFYEGSSSRPLHVAHFVGVERGALVERLETEGFEVWSMPSLLERRHDSDEPLAGSNAFAEKLTSGEGIVDRHGRAREQSGASEEEIVERTLAARDNWQYELSSAAYYLLGQSEHPARFVAAGDAGKTAYFLAGLFLGHAKHPLLTERLVAIFEQPHFATAVPSQTMARLVEEAPEAAASLAARRWQSLGPQEEAADRLALAIALYRHDEPSWSDAVQEAIAACLEDPVSSFNLDPERHLSVVFRAEPQLACRWLPDLWADRESSDVKTLFSVAKKHLPKQLDDEAIDYLRAAVPKARKKGTRSALAGLVKRYGLDVDAICPLPKTLADLDVTLEVGVDGAMLALVEPGAEDDSALDDLLRLVNRGLAVGFHTGTDGVFRVRMTGGGLLAAEQDKAAPAVTFAVRSKGELQLDSGTEQAFFFVPKGKLAVAVHFLDRGDDAALSDYVFAFRESKDKPTRRKALPTIPEA